MPEYRKCTNKRCKHLPCPHRGAHIWKKEVCQNACTIDGKIRCKDACRRLTPEELLLVGY